MDLSEREQLKEYLTEIDPFIEFDAKNEDKLIGYAERFGGTLLPIYDGINVHLYESEKTLEMVENLNPKARKADGFEDTIIGYINIDGEILVLHDRDKMMEQMIAEYESDPDLVEDEDYSFYTMAMENYQYNIIGAYMEGVPAFAVIENWR